MKKNIKVILVSALIVSGFSVLYACSNQKVSSYVNGTGVIYSSVDNLGDKKPEIIKGKKYKFKSEEVNNKKWYTYESEEMTDESIKNIEENVNNSLSKIKIGDTTIEELTNLFGNPSKVVVVHENGYYHLSYYYGEIIFYIGIKWEKVKEVRVEKENSRFVYAGGVKIGTDIKEVIEILGKPENIIDGKKNEWKMNVLYRDIDGIKGACYINYEKERVRIFFDNYKAAAIYMY